LSSCDPNDDPEDGHPIAYEAILRESQKFETTPLFLREDCDMVVNDPLLAANVPEWLAKSKQVATGNRRRVLENGLDVMSSSHEDDPKTKPDELTGVYTDGIDPTLGPVRLSQAQVAAQNDAARAPKPRPPRVESPLPNGSSDDDDPASPKLVWSMSKACWRPNKRWIDPNMLALPAPDVSTSGPTNEGTRGNPVMGSLKKRYLLPKRRRRLPNERLQMFPSIQ
jgi:hypothetical protein